MSKLRFFSNTLNGLSALRDAPALGMSRTSLPIEVILATSADGSTPSRQVKLSLEMYGPQDVTRFDASSISRREPRPNTRTVEPNYIPYIEFSHPALPWAFSPSGQAPYKPWLCLLVIPEGPSVRFEPNPESPHPIVTLTDVSALIGWTLPDLDDSVWWAHVQIAEDDTAITTPKQFTALRKAHPERVLSRILCPIRLQPNTSYLAVLVPTTKGGVAAGLAQREMPADALDPAWDATTASIRLPAYDHYTFKTGEAGDFESLVSRLTPTNLTGIPSERAMLVDAPYAGIPTTTMSWKTGHRGVFGPPDAPAPGFVPADIQGGLDKLFIQASTLSQGTSEPVLMPPVYGSLGASVTSFSTIDSQPFWLHLLNFDPRLRAAAGLGVRVIQQEQESLMQSAWAQAGAIREANDYLSRMQLARQASNKTHERLSTLSGADRVTLFQLVAPQLRRVRSALTNPPTPETAQAALKEEPITQGLTDPAFRRLTSHGASWMTHQTPIASTSVAYRVMIGSVPLALDPDSSQARVGMIPPQYEVPDSNTGMIIKDGYIRDLPHDDFKRGMSHILSTLRPSNGDIEHALWAHFATLHQEYDASYDASYQPPGPEDLKLVDSMRNPLLAQLDPEVVAPRQVASRTAFPALSKRDPLEPVVLGPKFDRPMFDPLKALDLGFVLPGIDKLDDNTMALLELNFDVIEAYMLGLNHEMARELMWRGYPTDTRATFFRQFFDISGYVPSPQTPTEREALYDLTSPVHTWQGTDELGAHIRGQGSSGALILALRGELFRRYPDTLLYMVPAFWHTLPDGSQIRRPDYNALSTTGKFAHFRAEIEPDLWLFWFEIERMQARGDNTPGNPTPGYFFVFQETMMGTRFGLDELTSDAPTDIATWKDLTWAHLDLTNSPYITSVPPTTVSSNPPEPNEGTWGTSGEQMATILYQQPYLVAIHADDMFVS